jgi:hypothetical protein
MGKSLLERIEARFGKCTAFDGRIAAWFGATREDSCCWDLRDIARLMQEDVGEVCDVVADGAPLPVKRGRKSAAVSEEKELPDFENNA